VQYFHLIEKLIPAESDAGIVRYRAEIQKMKRKYQRKYFLAHRAFTNIHTYQTLEFFLSTFGGILIYV